MNHKAQEVIKEILVRVAESPQPDRKQLLDEEISANLRVLQDEGAAKLRRLASFVEQASVLLPDDESGAPKVRVGNYRVGELIASGGMADVYFAVEPPPLERTVAVKILRRGLLSPQAFKRFQFERDSLKELDHPNIASVLDAGDTQDGFPFIVMPYIDGCHITRYANQECLSVIDRVRLVRQVCDGLSFAHRKGLVHRDLKPSNVLVAEGPGSEPIAKIIDFGIAKAAEASESGSDSECGVVRAGTRHYMSPEQSDGPSQEVDQRSDLYSLGVLFFELLTGELSPVGQHERKVASSHQPGTPGDLSGLAERLIQRRFAKELSKARIQELTWIVGKCLRRDPAERYLTSQALCDDVDRFLEGRAIEAAPASVVYRTTKWVRAHRVASVAMVLSFVGSVAIAIVLGLANRQIRIALRQAEEADAQKQEALIEKSQLLVETEATSEFLIDMIHTASASQFPLNRTVGEMLDHALGKIEDEGLASSSVRWKVRTMLASFLRVRGDLERSLEESDLAVEEAAGLHGVGSIAHSEALVTRASTLFEMGDPESARADYVAAIQAYSEAGEPRRRDRLAALGELAEVETALGRTQAAIEMLREAAATWDAYDPADAGALTVQLRLIDKLISAGQLEEGEKRIRHVESFPEAEFVKEGVLHANFELERALGNADAAYDAGEAYLNWCVEHLGPGSPRAFQMRVMLASLDTGWRSVDERVDDLYVLHDEIEGQLGENHPIVIHAKFALGSALREAEAPVEAAEWLVAGRDLLLEIFGSHHPNAKIVQSELARALLDAGLEANKDDYGVTSEEMNQARSELTQ